MRRQTHKRERRNSELSLNSFGETGDGCDATPKPQPQRTQRKPTARLPDLRPRPRHSPQSYTLRRAPGSASIRDSEGKAGEAAPGEEAEPLFWRMEAGILREISKRGGPGFQNSRFLFRRGLFNAPGGLFRGRRHLSAWLLGPGGTGSRIPARGGDGTPARVR